MAQAIEILLIIIVFATTGGLMFLMFGARERQMFKMFRRKPGDCMPLAWGDIPASCQPHRAIREELEKSARTKLVPADVAVSRISNWTRVSHSGAPSALIASTRFTDVNLKMAVIESASIIEAAVLEYDRSLALSLPKSQSLRGYVLALTARHPAFEKQGANLRRDAETFIMNYERARFGNVPWTLEEVTEHQSLVRRLVGTINTPLTRSKSVASSHFRDSRLSQL